MSKEKESRTPEQIKFDHGYLENRLRDLKHLRTTVKVREEELLFFSKNYKMRIDMDSLKVEDWGEY